MWSDNAPGSTFTNSVSKLKQPLETGFQKILNMKNLLDDISDLWAKMTIHIFMGQVFSTSVIHIQIGNQKSCRYMSFQRQPHPFCSYVVINPELRYLHRLNKFWH